MLPLDESMISLSGVRAPLSMASRIIWKAARSLTEPPGFMNSHLAQISIPGKSRSIERSRTIGVLPMRSVMLSATRARARATASLSTGRGTAGESLMSGLR